MAKYIEREEAIRETINSIVEILDIHNSISLTKIACKMREFPTADVVEVVRCKDCKRAKPLIFKNFYFCRKYRACRETDDYCSFGERRINND